MLQSQLQDRLQDQLLASLPSGEWDQVDFISSDTLMSGRAIFANARSLKHGGTPAFIKFILQATARAGAETKLLTQADRLDRMEARINSLSRLAVPTASVLECRRLSTPQGLLIAMERVTPLKSLIAAGTGDAALAMRLIAELTPDPSWHHLDVCPQNVALSTNGRFVFIDLESIYLAGSNGRINISVPSLKPYRVPAHIYGAFSEEPGVGPYLAADMAQQKQRFDIALLAAELSLGKAAAPLDFLLTVDALEEFLSNPPPQSAHLVSFWRQTLEPCVSGGKDIDVKALALGLSDAVSKGSQTGPTPTGPARVATNRPGDQWPTYQEMGRRLRVGALSKRELDQYRHSLTEAVQRSPHELALWQELILILVSYQSDAKEALSVARKAAAQFPQHDELLKMERIISLWAAQAGA